MNFLKKTWFVLLLLFPLFIFQFQVFGQSANFRYVVEERFAKTPVVRNGKKTVGIKLEEVCDIDGDTVADRVFREYGAVFVARDGVRLPPKCVFEDEPEVQLYQTSANPKTKNIGGTTITLQAEAMDALLDAVGDAADKNLRITPRGGSIAAKRTYEETVTLWFSRFNPGLAFWMSKGKISRSDADRARGVATHEQIAQVLEWEKKGYFFSKDFSKSILYSVAAPGASQHIFMLALDVEQFANPQVRKILAAHGWFQTVQSDLPHFTYLGVAEDQLPKLGLEEKYSGGQKFWVPKMR
jgi:hypothetical protein